jgi:hypothetical protein
MDTSAEITFVKRGKDNPSYIIKPFGQPSERQGEFDTKSVTIRDARQLETPPNLEANGFQLVPSKTMLSEMIKEADVPPIGYDEVKQAILATTGAAEVHIFDHTIRSSAPDNSERGTARHAHVDYSEWSFAEKMRTLGISTGQRRVAQINAWRPLKEPVRTAPLALADCKSLEPEDLIECDLIYPDWRGQIYELAHRPSHRWYFYPDMKRDELLLFKGFDSRSGLGISVCPHTAFTHPDETPDLPSRRSVELRTCVIY